MKITYQDIKDTINCHILNDSDEWPENSFRVEDSVDVAEALDRIKLYFASRLKVDKRCPKQLHITISVKT